MITPTMTDEPSKPLPHDSSEITSLLSSSSSLIDDQATCPNYGTARTDVEHGDNHGRQPKGVEKRYSNAFIAKTVIALLVGVFISNVDTSLVIAIHPEVASEFNALGDSSWLFIGFMLAGAATQTLYGRLSDIFGRKLWLLVCYGLFAVGCALIGVSRTMWQVILGRVISGSGGAGMQVLAALIITDLAPLREVGSWQSYLNIVATTGRSLGGPTGGWLADTIGWRWAFLGQTPIFALALVLCWLVLPTVSTATTARRTSDSSISSQLARIDFTGAFILGLALLSLMLPLEIGGQKVPWNHPIVFGLFGTGPVLLALFLLIELRWVREPIFSPRILRRPNVVLCYCIMGCQVAAQLGMMFTVPLYFKVTERSSNTVAGAHLFPAVVGNAVGGIASGYIIKRTGRYKALIIFAALSSFTSYMLLILRWHGHTNWAESLYIVPGGIGSGVASNAAFVALQASIQPTDKAAASSGFFLTMPVGSIFGMALASAIEVGVLRKSLAVRLLDAGLDSARVHEVVEQAVASVDYLDQAPPWIAKAAVASYVKGIEYSHLLSLACSTVAFLAALMLKERILHR
ncbi:major facilitator superfamily domain-containing protein [Pseudomassariella vexata]|uniref:Major facilitator superfamily domain-containing protein n=1 Tax=Pseudomassariella vexata TaxID=1141098 RepID=A0A1Y2E372_9PEZI|nr:major facilitator superfamily domain-containing protein [Pseudomassariella vexata]ORY65766.1 major facilitator superfamily domain-containing protein [Pseudomassariella vexata]